MKKIIWLSAFLYLAGCADFNKEYPLTPDDKVILPSVTAVGAPTETSVRQLADLLVEALNKSREEREQKEKALQKEQNEKYIKDSNQEESTINQALQSFINISKKQGAGEISLFFGKGVDTLEYSYTEKDRLVQFLDYLARESHGRKILLLTIGSASSVDTPSNKYQVYAVREKKPAPKKSVSNKIQLSVARAKAPIPLIEKYLINIPHQTYDAYGIGEHKDSQQSADPEKYQYVRIIAAFEKADLPLLPK
jgi:hypothetical protein